MRAMQKHGSFRTLLQLGDGAVGFNEKKRMNVTCYGAWREVPGQ